MTRFLRRESGQALILFTVAMPLCLAIMALAIDGAHMFVVKRQTQNAADAAALAAAAQLNTNNTPCAGPDTNPGTCAYKVLAAAQTYSGDNGGPSTLHACANSADKDCYLTPYQGKNQLVQVRITVAASTFFAGSLGFGSLFQASSHAAADATAITQTTPGLAQALFAKDSTCGPNKGIVVSGNPRSEINAVNSNGSVNMNGKGTIDNAFDGPTTANGGANPACNVTVTQGSVDNQSRNAAIQDWPETFDRTAICNQPGAHNATGVDLAVTSNGIWCSDTSVTLDKNHTWCVTIIAPVVNVSAGGGIHLYPYQGSSQPCPPMGNTQSAGLTIWQTQGDFAFTPNNSDVNGVIWVPNGRLTYGGNSGTTGFYEAQDISITGNSYTMVGTGPPIGGTTITTGTAVSMTE